jgi:trigger factor
MPVIEREPIGTLHDKITVKLAKEEYLPKFEKSLKQYAKNANIPGFRKGMVPAGMVRKMYGQSLLVDEVTKTISSELENYLKELDVALFGQPLAMPAAENMRIDINQPIDIAFSFEIGMKPEFEITPITQRERLTKYKIMVSDKMLNDEVENIQRRFGTLEEVEALTDKDQIVDGQVVLANEPGNEGSQSEQTMVSTVVAKLPVALQDQLMGKKAGDTITFRPADIAAEAELNDFATNILKAADADPNNTYKLTIEKVQQMAPKPLGEELYKEVFKDKEIATEEEFRNALQEDLSKQLDDISRQRLQNSIYELLVHATPIVLPADFLKRWQLQNSETPKTPEQIEQKYPQLDHQLRWQLISDKVMAENHIDVTKEEVREYFVKQTLSYFNIPSIEEAPWLEPYIAKMESNQESMEKTYNRLLTDKLFAFLETQFDIVEEPIEEEEYFKLPNEHAQYHQHG